MMSTIIMDILSFKADDSQQWNMGVEGNFASIA